MNRLTQEMINDIVIRRIEFLDRLQRDIARLWAEHEALAWNCFCQIDTGADMVNKAQVADELEKIGLL